MIELTAQIEQYIKSLPEPKQADIRHLHQEIQGILPGARLWFLDGKNEEGKIVSNPNIGYGSYTIHYADGKTREFYQIGLSANSSGFSVYIMGLADKQYLSATYAPHIGKASVSGYCIKFKKLADLHMSVLAAAIRDGVAQTSKKLN